MAEATTLATAKRIDVRTVIIIAILSAGGGAYLTKQDPAQMVPAAAVSPATVVTTPGK